MLHYIAVVGGLESLGILQKINGKMAALQALGRQTRAVLLLNQGQSLPPNTSTVQYLSYGGTWDPQGYQATIDYLSQQCAPGDSILLRYPVATPGLLRLLRAFPRRIWLEHNTKELEELWSNLRKYTWRDWAYMLKTFNFRDARDSLAMMWNERWYGPRAFALAAGGICVTDEISAYESARSPGGAYRCFTVGNGIDTNKIELRPKLAYDRRTLRLIMASASPNPWHGADRLLHGLRNYQGETRIEVELVGRFTSTVSDLVAAYGLQDAVKFWPLLPSTELNELQKSCHIGLGSLGMHRIPLREGSVLKVKEYMAAGMPFVIAHEELELRRCAAMRPYYLQLPADDSPVDIEALLAFAEKVYSEPEHASQIRRLAVELIDMKVKMAELLAVLHAQERR